MTSAPGGQDDQQELTAPHGLDRWDFGQLFAMLYQQAVAFAMSHSKGDRYDAEDAVQSAFMALMESRPRLHTAGSERAYLFAIILHMVQRQARYSRLSLPVGDLHLDLGVLDEPEVEIQGWAASLLRELPPRQRQALTLTAEGYKPAEIAALLDIEPVAVRVHLHHARAKLQARLAAGQDRAAA